MVNDPIEIMARALWKASGGLSDSSPEPRVHEMYLDYATAALKTER